MYYIIIAKYDITYRQQFHKYSISKHAGFKGIGNLHLHALYICTTNTSNIITHYLRLTPTWWGSTRNTAYVNLPH